MTFDPSEVFAPADPGAQTPPADPGSQVAPAAPQDPGPAGTPATPHQAAPGGDEWEIPGVGRVSRDELIKGYLRQQDYSRKTAALSQRDREFESVRQQSTQYEAALRQVHGFLQDRAQLAKYLETLPGGEPQLAPDQILTAAEAQALLQRKLGESEQAQMRRFQEFQQQTLQQTYQTQYEQAIDNKLRDIQGRHPELVKVPGMEVLLRNAVQSQRPQSIDDALSLFDQAATFYATRFKEFAKSGLPSPNNPVNRGVLPPTTGAPAPQAEAQDFSGVKDPNLRNLVIRDIEAILARSPGA
jgi:hypothetical protein